MLVEDEEEDNVVPFPIHRCRKPPKISTSGMATAKIIESNFMYPLYTTVECCEEIQRVTHRESCCVHCGSFLLMAIDS